MNQTSVKLLQKKYIVPVSLAAATLWLVFIYAFLGIYFETNDDRYMVEILSGALTGKCDPHIIFVNYILSLPLAFLYSITTAVPWYGLMLIVFQLLSFGIIIYSVLKLCRTLKDACIYVVLLFVIFFSGLYLTGLIQFTSTAALLAIAGYVYLFFTYISEKCFAKHNYVIFFGLELLGFFVRENSMLMISAPGLGTFLGLCIYTFLTENSIFSKKQLLSEAHTTAGSKKHIGISSVSYLKELCIYVLHKLLPVLACLVLVFAIGKAGNAYSYRGSEWDTYNRFNVARANLFDYQGAPVYEDVKHILDKYNVSEKEYKAFTHYTILESNISADCIEELENYVYADKPLSTSYAPESLLSALSATFSTYLTSDLWSIGRLLLAFYLLTLAGIFLYHKYLLLIPVLGLFASRTIAWLFLLYKGRIVNRVSLPLYLCEAFMLLFIFMVAAMKPSTDNNKCFRWKLGIFLLLCLPILKSGYHTGMQQLRYVKEQNDTQKIYMEGLVELQNYINSHDAKTFLIEANSLSYYRGSALETRVYNERNGLVTGCWYSQSPPMVERIHDYLSSADSSVSFIVAEGSEERFTAILSYLEEYLGSTPVLNDQFTASHGGTYLVYCFE